MTSHKWVSFRPVSSDIFVNNKGFGLVKKFFFVSETDDDKCKGNLANNQGAEAV